MSQDWHFEPTSQIILAKNLEILGGDIFLNLSKIPTNSLQKRLWNTCDGFKNFLPGRLFLLPNYWDIIILCSHSNMKVCECTKHQTLFNFNISVIPWALVTALVLLGFQIFCDILEIWIFSEVSMQYLLFSFNLLWS